MSVQPQARSTDSPLSALRRKWWLALVLCPLGAALGATVASTGATKYTAETRLAVGQGELSQQAVPGYAAAAQQLAEDYSRVLNNTQNTSPNRAAEITSTPIPESNIVRIEATADSQAVAMQQVQQSSQYLVTYSKTVTADKDPEKVLAQYLTAAQAAASLETDVDAQNTRYQNLVQRNPSASALAASKATLDKLKSQSALAAIKKDTLGAKYQTLVANQTTATQLQVVRQPWISTNDRVAKLQRYGLIGFVLGGLLSLLLASSMERRKPPVSTGRRSEPTTTATPWAQTNRAGARPAPAPAGAAAGGGAAERARDGKPVR